MVATKTFGRWPTLGEMKEYYSRDDVLSFIYDECRIRNVDIAFRAKRIGINPKSKAELRAIIEKDITDKIEKAYQDVTPVDDARLKKHDYLSFHSQTSIASDGKLVGFDVIFEADVQGWRKAFEDLYGVVKMLDGYGVCYRIKYSGVRSLHLMIPFESFPSMFNGELIFNKRNKIQEKLQKYFHRHCGMEKAHGGSVMRLAYSLNEDIGLVSLPITSDELAEFRPYEANIHNVTVDKPWHGDIPVDAQDNMENFLHEVYKEDKKNAKKIIYNLEIKSKNHAPIEDKSNIDELLDTLKSDDQYKRVEASWKLLYRSESLPFPVLREAINDENPDVRWYMAELLQKNLNADAINLAGKMLWDKDQFVRISAIDALALSGDKALQEISESLSQGFKASINSLHDVIYAMQKLCSKSDPIKLKSLVIPLGKGVSYMVRDKISDTRPWEVRSYIRSIRDLCKPYDIVESVLLHHAIKEVTPIMLKSFSELEAGFFKVSIFRDLHKNDAMVLLTMRDIADFLGIKDVKIPSNRMSEEERIFLAQVIHESLADMTAEQKINIITVFWFNCGKKIRESSGNLLAAMDKQPAIESIKRSLHGDFQGFRLKMAIDLLNRIDPSAVETVTEWQKTQPIKFSDESKIMAQKNSIDELIGMLESKSWHIRQLALHALAQKCESDEDVGRLIKVLRSKNYKARVAAIHVLGSMSQNAKARVAILGAINESCLQVRKEALRIYVRSEPLDAVDVLLRVLKRRDAMLVKQTALREIKRYMNEDRVINIIKEMRDDVNQPEKIRATAENMLQKIK